MDLGYDHRDVPRSQRGENYSPHELSDSFQCLDANEMPGFLEQVVTSSFHVEHTGLVHALIYWFDAHAFTDTWSTILGDNCARVAAHVLATPRHVREQEVIAVRVSLYRGQLLFFL